MGLSSARSAEHAVYAAVIAALEARGCTVVCACPPVGTDARYKKCMFPRAGGDKGARDEVDLGVVTPSGYLLLIEAKGSLSECLFKANQRGETDHDKLVRLMAFNESVFLGALSQAYGRDLNGLRRLIGFAYAVADAEVPSGCAGLWAPPGCPVEIIGVPGC